VGDQMVVGKEAKVACSIVGGSPTPKAYISIQGRDVEFSKPSLVSGEEDTITLTASFLPQMEDLSNSLACTVTQMDNEGTVLYNHTQVLAEDLPLQYPPQPQVTGEVEAVLGEPITLAVTVRSNPEPSQAVWSVECGENKDDNPCSVRLQPGVEDDRFNVSEISETDSGTYQISLSLLKVEERDFTSVFSLNVWNSLGNQNYDIHLTPEPVDETTSVPGVTSSDSGKLKVTGSEVLVVVIGLVLVVLSAVVLIVIYRRRKAGDSELAPLTQKN